MLILKDLDLISKIIAENNPKIAPYAIGISKVMKTKQEELKTPEAWEEQKNLIIIIMGFIPPAIPYIAPVSLIFDVIIAIVKAESENVQPD